MTAIPNSLALEDVPANSDILSAPHRDNYGNIQTTVNAILNILKNGQGGQFLQSLDANNVGWSASGTSDGQVLQWIQGTSRFGPALILDKNIDPAANIAVSKIASGYQISSLGGYPNDATKFACGDGTWKIPPNPIVGLSKIYDSVDAGVVFPTAAFDIDLTNHQNGKGLIVELDLRSNAANQDTLKIQINGINTGYYTVYSSQGNGGGSAPNETAFSNSNAFVIGGTLVPSNAQSVASSLRTSLRIPDYAATAFFPQLFGTYTNYQSAVLLGGTVIGALNNNTGGAATSLHIFLGSGQISAGRCSVYKEV